MHFDMQLASSDVASEIKAEISTHPSKEELVSQHNGLEDEDTHSHSSDWINEIDRGHVNKTHNYMMFVAMEEEVRKHFYQTNAPK